MSDLIDDFAKQFPELANARVTFWTCSDDAHRRTGCVEWRGDVAHCLEPGCGRTSADPRPRKKFELDVPMVVQLKTDTRPLTHNDRMHWRKRAPKVKTIRQVTAANATAAHIPLCQHITVTLHYAPGDKASVTDSPNLTATSKPAIDGLVDARVVPNDTDRYVTEVMPVIHLGPGTRRLWLEIEVTP
jgi:crossover junction endodeoxyribonuclease RusA